VASLNWIRGIEHPTFAGWLTVALYLATSLSCWRSGGEAERCAWRSIAIVFLALGVNKLLNLETALTAFGRAVAHLQGWYERRQPVQMVLIGLAVMSCVFVVITLLTWMRRAPIATWLALMGTTFTLTFVLIRAISYHDVDRFLLERILGVPWNFAIEMGGISVVLLASQWRQAGHSKSTSALRAHR